MNFKIIVIIFISIIIVGCNSNEIKFEKLDENLRLFCEEGNNELVIYSKEDFDNNNCEVINTINESTENDFIDYNKYVLISNFASSSGCSTTFENTIIKDEQNKKIIHTIDITRNRRIDCDNIVGGGGTYLIPKIPQDYEIEFRIEQSKGIMYYLSYWMN